MRFRIFLVFICQFCLAKTSISAPLDPSAFTSLGEYVGAYGTTAVNTSGTPTMTMGGVTYTGVVHSQGPGLPEIAVFTFDKVTIPDTTTIVGSGSRPMAILSRTTFVLNGAIDVAALRDASGAGGGFSGADGSTGGLGRGLNGVGQDEGGGGASFGGYGGSSLNGRVARAPYGDLSVALHAGSAGGLPDPTLFTQRQYNGGGAGGGVELGAVGNMTLSAAAQIRANGGTTGLEAAGTPGIGGGSGGGVILHAAKVDLPLGSLIDVHGGNGTDRNFAIPSIMPSGGGSGGRIYIQQSTLTLGADYVSSLNVAGGIGGDLNGAPRAGTKAGDGAAGHTHVSAQRLIVPNGQIFDFTIDGLTQLNFRDLDVESGGIVAKTGAYVHSFDLTLDSGALFGISGAITNATNARYNLTGGTIVAGGGITLSQNALLRGYGVVSGRFTASGTTAGTVQVDPGGTLALGDANSTSGVVLDATFRIFSNAGQGSTLVLNDADRAVVGNGLIQAGSILHAPKGITLLANRTITAERNTQIGGSFQNLGTIAGPTTTNDYLTFTDNVTGNGNYTGNVLFSDGFSPGNSPAAVSLGTVAFDATTTLTMEIGGIVAGTSYDQLVVSGNALLGGATLELIMLGGFSPSIGQSFEILDIAGARSGTFAGLNEGSLVGSFGGTGLFISYAGGDGNDVVLNVAAIPEPTTAGILVIAVMGLIIRRRMRRYSKIHSQH